MNDDVAKAELWDYMLETGIANEQTLRIVTTINGYRLDVLEDVLFVITGYRTLAQLRGELEDDE